MLVETDTGMSIVSERLVPVTLADGSVVRDCPLMLSAVALTEFLNFDSVNQFHRWRYRVGLEPIPATKKYSTVAALNLLCGKDDEIVGTQVSDPGIAALERAGLS